MLIPDVCDARATDPVDDAASDDWVTSMAWAPRVRPVPAARLANPRPPPWDTSSDGCVSTICDVEATVPVETSELAVASCWTTNCRRAGRRPRGGVGGDGTGVGGGRLAGVPSVGGGQIGGVGLERQQVAVDLLVVGHVGVECGLLILQVRLGLLKGLELGLDDLLRVQSRFEAVVDDGRGTDRGRHYRHVSASLPSRSAAGVTAGALVTSSAHGRWALSDVARALGRPPSRW